MPASAAAVLSALTADAPVAATAVGQAAAAVEDDDDFSVGEQEQVLVGAAAPAPLAPAGSEQPSAEERESAYRQRISTVMADSKLGYGATIAQQQAKAERVARALRKRVSEGASGCLWGPGRLFWMRQVDKWVVWQPERAAGD